MISKQFLTLKETVLKRSLAFSNRFQFPEKWKGGRIDNMRKFWIELSNDYKSVVTETVTDFKTKPYKATAITSGIGVLLTAIKTNPNEQSFSDCFLKNSTDLTMVGDPIRNPTAEEHITYLTRCENQGLLKRMNLIFLTIIWVADYHRDCDIYSAQCKYLKPSYLTFHERIIDVGMFGAWFNMKLKMRNFDINPNEWNSVS